MVTMWSSNAAERPASIAAPPESDVEDIDFIDVLSTGIDTCVIPGSLSKFSFLVNPGPAFSGIIAAEKSAIFGLNLSPDAIGIDR